MLYQYYRFVQWIDTLTCCRFYALCKYCAFLFEQLPADRQQRENEYWNAALDK